MPAIERLKLSFIGVDFFFVISGFLISYQLFGLKRSVDSKQVDLLKAIGHFTLRRAYRIFPLYYVVLILATLFNKGAIREALFYNLSYTSNFYFIKAQNWSGTFSHFWSLSVEEHFYLFWPILLLMTKRNFIRLIIIGIAVFSLAFRYFSFAESLDFFAVRIHTLACLDLFMFGALLAYFLFHDKSHFLVVFSRKRVKYAVLLGLFLSYVSVIVLHDEPVYIWVFFRTIFGLFSVGLLGLLVVGFKGKTGRLFENKWLVLGGKLSYAIYLLHNFVPGLLLGIKTLDLPLAIEFLVYFVTTIVISWLLHYLVEKPARRLGQKYKISFG